MVATSSGALSSDLAHARQLPLNTSSIGLPPNSADLAPRSRGDTRTAKKRGHRDAPVTANFVMRRLDRAPYAEARKLLESTVARCDEMRDTGQWVPHFRYVAELLKRFEQRTVTEALHRLLPHPKNSELEVDVLAKAYTYSTIEHLVRKRLDVVAQLPEVARADAWRASLHGVMRSNMCKVPSGVLSLARFIGHLAEADRTPAAITLIRATRAFNRKPEKGWDELVDALLDAVPPSQVASMARKMVRYDEDLNMDMDTCMDFRVMRAHVSAISRHLPRVPEKDFGPLILHLVKCIKDNFVWSTETTVAMLGDLQSCLRRRGIDDDIYEEVRGAITHAFEFHRELLSER